MPSSSSLSESSSSESESSSRAVQSSQKRKRHARDDLNDSDSGSNSTSVSTKNSDPGDSDAEDVPQEDDVPVLSHAEQRRQKKKQLSAEKKAQVAAATADNEAPKTKKQKVKNTAELAPSKVPKRQNSVWVGNLSFKTTPESVRKFFDGVGEITRVHMPIKMASAGPGGRGAVKENRGFAYVDFATPEAKTIAITLSENPLDGRKLLIKDGDDFTGRPAATAQLEASEGSDARTALTGHSKTAQKILKSQKQPPASTLFLGNLGFETTEQSVRDLFTRNRVAKVDGGNEDADADKPEPKKDQWIRKVRMGTFEDSGKCKGWAFVDLFTTEHATAALTNPKNHFLDGRKLVVEYASPEAVRRGGGLLREKTKDVPHQQQDEAAGGGHEQKRRAGRVRPKRKSEVAEGAAERQDERLAKRPRLEREEPPHKAWEGREGRQKIRAKPGAALANAKRETAGIVPSQGKKIVF
ncbi:uncharacterized protein PHACADRAFT_137996 [Phanerochaete carnosa HHB-10118-sp]|uniref:RRM domain-containing protein n=1 Tax=Phanerochaete carnosa (strain HHB-10118-sp) TaxID=650164 RepID=K5XA33_PHACS|nr:uncharacterized protein PHACADRAFT_137996 [Phanerochaete carnosa HHB-10118-sp]EKM59782.1 hypothetical protein PHACADRAFT_137996 [Phanerochaete carnosa HHB-10118-sp]